MSSLFMVGVSFRASLPCLILNLVQQLINIFINPKLLLNGRIYTLTVVRVLNTNLFQINPGKLLLRATLKVRLGSCLSTALEMDNLDCTKINAHFKKSFMSASIHCQPHLSCRKTTHSSVSYTATVEMSCLQHCSTNGKLPILVKAQPSTPSTTT